MLQFDSPLAKLPFITKATIQKLDSLGIRKISDLLYYFPFRYEDYSVFKNISQLLIGETTTIQGKIEDIKTTRAFRKKIPITEAYISDKTGTIKAVWFNFPSALRLLTKGKYVQISGKTSLNKKNELFFSHPNFEIIAKSSLRKFSIQIQKNSSVNTGGLVPVYPETKDIHSYWLRRVIKKTLSLCQIKDFIPSETILSQKLLPLKKALWEIHFPTSSQMSLAAKKRFAFEKMLLLQIKSLQVKNRWQKSQAVSIKFNQKLIQSFVKKLPFKLTNAQKKAAWQIIKDLEKNLPMNRLLEGDVGSGKTVVAALAILSVLKQKKQAVLLAPTEILAVQHFKSFLKFFKEFNFKISVLTHSQTKINSPLVEENSSSLVQQVSKKSLFQKIKKGQVDLIIGTHALLNEAIQFKNLALVIIDEQHRFGVNQRAFLQQKALVLDDGSPKTIPHLLTMTATPIPRTLSLALFGNLDFSIIDEYPQGRKSIITKIVPPEEREIIYQFTKKQIQAGQQVFIICPLVEESSKITEVKSATTEFERLKKEIFSEFSLGLIHGKIKAHEKNEVMKKFKNKEIDILVSTAVVEVGVDVPNATIMIIEGAERFGLAQLHQFRGRVGRGTHQSFCFLFTSANSPQNNHRLKILEKTNNGLKIAEYDLKFRGPGQFLGTLQSGTPDIAMESLSDLKLIQQARQEAQKIIAISTSLKKFPLLKKQVDQLESVVHWE